MDVQSGWKGQVTQKQTELVSVLVSQAKLDGPQVSEQTLVMKMPLLVLIEYWVEAVVDVQHMC